MEAIHIIATAGILVGVLVLYLAWRYLIRCEHTKYHPITDKYGDLRCGGCGKELE